MIDKQITLIYRHSICYLSLIAMLLIKVVVGGGYPTPTPTPCPECESGWEVTDHEECDKCFWDESFELCMGILDYGECPVGPCPFQMGAYCRPIECCKDGTVEVWVPKCNPDGEELCCEAYPDDCQPPATVACCCLLYAEGTMNGKICRDTE